jgi:hypothetical protein
MKIPALLILFCISCLYSRGQVVVQNNLNSSSVIEAYDLKGRPIANRAAEIEGTPYCTENWGRGTVIFATGERADAIELNFNQLDNTPLFKKGGEIFSFVHPVKEIRFRVEENGRQKDFLFRNSYPEAGSKSTPATYYQVLTEGNKYHLLSLVSKRVGEVFVHPGKSDKAYQQEKSWFIYDVARNQMLHVPAGKRGMEEFLAASPNEIKSYLNGHKGFNVKEENDLVSMVSALNL